MQHVQGVNVVENIKNDLYTLCDGGKRCTSTRGDAVRVYRQGRTSLIAHIVEIVYRRLQLGEEAR